jgi:hypothetical protein
MLAPTATGTLLAETNLSNALMVGLWVMLAAILGVAGTRLALAVRRRFRTDPPTQTFTLQDLRELRDKGELSEQEFAALRALTLSRMAADAPDSAERPDAADLFRPPTDE